MNRQKMVVLPAAAAAAACDFADHGRKQTDGNGGRRRGSRARMMASPTSHWPEKAGRRWAGAGARTFDCAPRRGRCARRGCRPREGPRRCRRCCGLASANGRRPLWSAVAAPLCCHSLHPKLNKKHVLTLRASNNHVVRPALQNGVILILPEFYFLNA